MRYPWPSWEVHVETQEKYAQARQRPLVYRSQLVLYWELGQWILEFQRKGHHLLHSRMFKVSWICCRKLRVILTEFLGWKQLAWSVIWGDISGLLKTAPDREIVTWVRPHCNCFIKRFLVLRKRFCFARYLWLCWIVERTKTNFTMPCPNPFSRRLRQAMTSLCSSQPAARQEYDRAV